MPLGTLRRRTAGRDSRGGRLFRRTHVGRHRPCTGSLGGPGAGHRTPSDDPETLRLPENFGRLQLEMRLLRHPAHPRWPRLRPDGGAGGGGPQAGRAERPGADGHRAGHDLLRHRPLRPADARRAAAPPVPHRRHRMDPAPLRLPRRVPRRGDRGDGLGAENLQVPRHSVPAHFRCTARVDVPRHSVPRPRPWN